MNPCGRNSTLTTRLTGSANMRKNLLKTKNSLQRAATNMWWDLVPCEKKIQPCFFTTTGREQASARNGPEMASFVRGSVRFWLAGGIGPGISQFAFILSHVVVSLEQTLMM